MRRGRSKIAVCTYQSRVCPRFDLSREILIYDYHSPEKEPAERIDVSSFSPLESLNVLVAKEVHVVIVGGIQERYQEIFVHHHIKVIWGVIGEVNDAIEAYKKKSLHPGIGKVP
jgi:predicted Fe-Mo cluster-binding NifX family protein